MSETEHPTMKDGWFSEVSDSWPGQAACLQVDKVLCHEKSLFQDILIFESRRYGKVLVLDNVIQCTERDEFAYQEMISHLALNSHSKPKKVLVIGGGDGRVLREVLKHDCVEEVVLCDIDEAVIRLSQQHMPSMSASFTHPKVSVVIGDGLDFIANCEGKFDVIITDSSDPEGPAHDLFQKAYFESLFRALREGGIVTTQAGSIWLDLPMITTLKKQLDNIFPIVEYAYTTVPTYPSGQIGFFVCCAARGSQVKEPVRTSALEKGEQYKYYNSNVHSASFVLPAFASAALTRA